MARSFCVCRNARGPAAGYPPPLNDQQRVPGTALIDRGNREPNTQRTIPMPEARRGQGARTRLGAQIIFNDRASVIDCVVTNISFSGAELVFADTREIPNDFELCIPSKCSSRRARLVWRYADGVGVAFRPDSLSQASLTSPCSRPSAAARRGRRHSPDRCECFRGRCGS